jgi:hypothetical protein
MRLPGVSYFSRAQTTSASDAQQPAQARPMRNPFSAFMSTTRLRPQTAANDVFAEAGRNSRPGRTGFSWTRPNRSESTGVPSGSGTPAHERAEQHTSAAGPEHAAPSQPSFHAQSTGQQRIDQARAEYRNAARRLEADIHNAKFEATTKAKLEISAAEKHIGDIGLTLDKALHDLDKQAALTQRNLENETVRLKQQLKALAREIAPLQSAGAASGTNSRQRVELDPETANKAARFVQLSHQRNAIKERLEAVTEQIARHPDETAALRMEMIEQSGTAIGLLNDRIAARDIQLKEDIRALDNRFEASIAEEKSRIAVAFGVQFR